MYYLNLQLFGEGGEGGASTGAEGAISTGVTSESGTEVTTESGKEAGTEDRGAQYAKFKEEYKDEFQKDFNSAFGKRFKGMKETEEKLKSYDNNLKPLYKKYGVDNPEALAKAFRGDPSNYAEESERTGISAELLAARAEIEDFNNKAEEEKAAKEAEEIERKKLEAIKRTVEGWEKEAEEVKKLHPEFDFKEASNNPDFQRGLRFGMPMLTLYRSLNFDSISKSIEETARKAAIESVKQGNGRPSEVGADSTKAVSADMDVNSLTGEDIDEILERVRKGEKISFTP